MVYYLTRLIEADLQVVNSATQARAALLVEEFENIRTAWEWAVQTGDAHWLDHAAHPLTILVICRGWPRLTVTFLAQGATALETSSLRSARFVRGRLLAMESLAWRMLGNYSYVLQCAEQALVLLKGSEDPASIAMAQNLIGATKIEEGDYEEAEHYLDQALKLATEHQQPVITANTHFWHGRLAVFRGEFDLAKIHLHCSLELYRSVNEEIGALRCMNILAELPARRHDDLLSSLASFEEVLIHARRLGDARTLSVALENVGVTRVLTGQDPAPALALLEESLALNQKIGNTVGLSYLLHAIAYAHIHLGHFDAAAHALQQGIAHLGVKRLGEQPQLRSVLLELLEGFGLLYSRQGDSVKAVEILSLAATHPSTPDFTRRRATQELATLAAQLSAESYAAAAERGHADSLDRLLSELVAPSAMQLGSGGGP
jgi:tetratricopeptide (TPR) repeat protein